MKKSYKIDVDCAACADKMEQLANRFLGHLHLDAYPHREWNGRYCL